MGVQVDEAGCDEQPGRIDLASRVAVDGADRRDHAVGDRDIAHIGLPAEAVNDGAIPDAEVECRRRRLVVVNHQLNVRRCPCRMPGWGRD